MNLSFEPYFTSLSGAWSLQRKISTGETLTAKAVFETITDAAFILREDGKLLLLNGTSINASRNWFWFLHQDKQLEVTYDKARLNKYHFLNLQITNEKWFGSSDHLCGADHYFGQYEFEKDKFQIRQTVKGPNKDYIISSTYTRE